MQMTHKIEVDNINFFLLIASLLSSQIFVKFFLLSYSQKLQCVKGKIMKKGKFFVKDFSTQRKTQHQH